MSQLRVYLPPFGPDYSGACNLLFPFNSMLVIHDANGCTSNYTSYDEPRWYGSKKAVFCSALRKIDVAMGDEEKFLKRISHAATELKPDFIAFVGSPVPLVMGTDFEGFAVEVEERTGIACLGLATNGTGQYQEGIAMAGMSLLDRFLPDDRKVRPQTVNLLGATPMDFHSDCLCSLQKGLADRGWQVVFCLSDENLPLDIMASRQAAASIALGEGGREIGRWLEKYYQIPWLAACPIGDHQLDVLVAELEKLVTGQRESGYLAWTPKREAKFKGLLLHEPVIGLGMVQALESAEPDWRWDLASPFVQAFDQASPNCSYLPLETDLIQAVNQDYDFIVADPLILKLVDKEKATKLVKLGHFAISSHFCQADAWRDRTDKFVENIIERCFE